MSAPLIAFVGLVYLAVAFDSALRGNWGLCIAFSGYSFSNIGLAMLAK